MWRRAFQGDWRGGILGFQRLEENQIVSVITATRKVFFYGKNLTFKPFFRIAENTRNSAFSIVAIKHVIVALPEDNRTIPWFMATTPYLHVNQTVAKHERKAHFPSQNAARSEYFEFAPKMTFKVKNDETP